MERNLALELVRVTEAAALAAARENGRGDEMGPERSAAQAIAHAFSSIGAFQGEVVLGDPAQAEGDERVRDVHAPEIKRIGAALGIGEEERG